jgi:hypothetical protein
MPPPDALAIIALTTLALFAVSFASLIRLTCAGVLEGRNAGGSPSLEAILHSIAKMIMVIVITVAQSRILLAPDWPGGSFAPDLSMLLAGTVSLIAAVPAAGLLAMTVRPGARPRLAVLMVAAIVATGAGQAVMSGVAGGRDPGALLAPSSAAPILACGLVGGAGLYLHAQLVRRLLAQPNNIRLALADTATSAISTTLSAWLGCLAYAISA